MTPDFRPPKPQLGNLIRSLAIGIGLAYVVTVTLTKHGVSLPIALAISAICPLGDTLYEYARRRQIGAVDVLSLIGIVAGVGLSLTSGNARFALAKESVISGVIGAAFLASIARGRPAIFYLAKESTSEPERFDWLWDHAPPFRVTMRRMTLLWGGGLVTESALRIVSALTFDPNVTVTLSPVIAAVTFTVLIGWTLLWSRHAQRAAAPALLGLSPEEEHAETRHL